MLTLKQYAEHCEQSFREGYGVGPMVADLLEPNAFLEGYEPPPYTWRDRLSDYRNRARDAWAVLTGKATIGHDDYDY